VASQGQDTRGQLITVHHDVVPDFGVVNGDHIVEGLIEDGLVCSYGELKGQFLAFEAVVVSVETMSYIPSTLGKIMIHLGNDAFLRVSASSVVLRCGVGQHHALVLLKDAVHQVVNGGCLVALTAVEGAGAVGLVTVSSATEVVPASLIFEASSDLTRAVTLHTSDVPDWWATHERCFTNPRHQEIVNEVLT